MKRIGIIKRLGNPRKATYRPLIHCLILAGFFSLHPLAYSQHIVINEFLASNTSVNADDDGDSSDWIELYNADTLEINLENYTLTDSKDNPDRWIFPSISLPPMDHLIIWASGKNRRNEANPLHTNFKLNAEGEFIGLYSPDSLPLDTLTYTSQWVDTSYGRLPDGSDFFTHFSNPTPHTTHEESPVAYYTLTISQPSGVYNGPVTVSIHSEQGIGTIRYTVDGKEPNQNKSFYTTPLTFTNNTVLRAQLYDGSQPISDIESRTYILYEDPDLPILTIAIHPENFSDIHDDENWRSEGIAFERPADVALIENGETRFSIHAGLRIHGNQSRRYDKKSFRLYFRNEYGKSRLEYPLFPLKEIDSFKRLVLHASSDDQSTATGRFSLICDVMAAALYDDMGGLSSTYKPVALYINSAYWGMYWIRERIDEHFVESNRGFSDMDLHRLKWGTWEVEVLKGDDAFWNETFTYLLHYNLRDKSRYDYFTETFIDIPNFTKYYLLNIFINNNDWPHFNMERYRNREAPDTTWKWALWDPGSHMHYSPLTGSRSLTWAIRDEVRTDIYPNDGNNLLWSTIMIRRLLEYEEYKYYFINTAAELMNTVLTTDHIVERVDEFQDMIDGEMKRELEHWTPQYSVADWNQNIEAVRNYGRDKPGFLRSEFISTFNLHGTASITLLPSAGEGQVTIHTLTPDTLPWSGIYFQRVPVAITAEPGTGYIFHQWSDTTLPDTACLSLVLSGDITLQAEFIPIVINNQVVINEINYNSHPGFDPGDWVELTNFSDESVDLSGWCFQDENDAHSFVIPANTVLPPDSFLVLCQDTAVFHVCFPDANDAIGNMPFGLSGDGELIRLMHQSGLPVDSLVYDDESPWPEDADGMGPTLELVSPELDNALPEHWSTGTGYGTPGRLNLQDTTGTDTTGTDTTGIDTTGIDTTGDDTTGTDTTGISFWLYNIHLPENFQLFQNHPNPFNPETTIRYQLPVDCHVSLRVYNVNGREICTLLEKEETAGYHKIIWQGRNNGGVKISSGVYLLHLTTDTGYKQNRKMILFR